MTAIEATVSAVGKELTALFGRRSTRLTALSGSAESTILSSAATTTASVSGTTVTLAAAIDNSGIQAGDLLEITTGNFEVQSGGDCSRWLDDPRYVDFRKQKLRARKSGAGASIATGSPATINVARAAFTTADVGAFILVWDTTNVANSGLYTVTGVPSATSVQVTNGSAVAETSSFAWELLAPKHGDRLVISDESIDVRISDIPQGEFALRRAEVADDLVSFQLRSWSIHSETRRAVITATTTTTMTLAGEGFGANPSAVHWRVVRPAATSLAVETTLNWEDQDEFFCQGQRYRYAAKTLTTLVGIERWASWGWTSGLYEAYQTGTPVVDWAQNYSGFDQTRAALIVTRATGEDLGAHAFRTSVTVSPTASEDQLREIIQAIGYAARGPQYAIEQLLDVVLGVGTWEIFEDNTSSAAGFGGLDRNPATVYLRRLTDATAEGGKAFLENDELIKMATTSTVTIPNPSLSSNFVSCRLAPDPARPVPSSYRSGNLRRHTSRRLVAFGPGSSGDSPLAMSTDGVTVTFDTNLGLLPQVGDIFQITAGPLEGERAVIADVSGLGSAPYTVDLGVLAGTPNWELPAKVWASGTRSLRTLQFGTDTERKSSVQIISGSSAIFPNTIPAGAILQILDDDGDVIEQQTVSSRDSSKKLTLSAPLTNEYPDSTYTGSRSWRVIDATDRASFSPAPFEIWRPYSNFRHYLPSAEKLIEYAGDTGTQIWDTDITASARLALTSGSYIAMTEDTGSTGTTEQFQHYLRATSEDAFEATFHVWIDPGELRATSYATQIAFGIYTGGRAVMVGVCQDNHTSGAFKEARLRFCDEGTLSVDSGGFLNKQAGGTMNFASSTAAVNSIVTLIDARAKTVTFQFTTGTVTDASYVKVNIDPSSSTGADIGDAFRTALAAQQLAGTLDIQLSRSDTPATASVILEQEWPSPLGNTTITTNGTGWSKSDFSGGTGVTAREGRLDGTQYKTYRITVEGNSPHISEFFRICRLYEDGVLIDEARLGDFHGKASYPAQVIVGMFDNDSLSTQNELRIKWIDWSVESSYDYLWQQQALAACLDNTVFAAASFTSADIGREIVLPYSQVPNAGTAVSSRYPVGEGGYSTGVWTIESVLSGNEVTVRGPKRHRATFPTRFGGQLIEVDDGTMPFIWPRHLGHKVKILSGPNAGTFPIIAILDPYNEEEIRTTTTQWYPSLIGEDGIRERRSNLVIVDTKPPAASWVSTPSDQKFDSSSDPSDWHLVPVFGQQPSTYDVVDPYYIVGRHSFSSPTLTTGSTMPSTVSFTSPSATWTPLMAVRRTRQLSAHVGTTRDVNVPDGAYEPFYLWDAWGFLRPLIESLTAAGVIPDFDSLTRDEETGLHIGA